MALAAGGAGASTQRLSDQSWTDPVGDAPGVVDISAVTITDDYKTGTIAFKVVASGLAGGPYDLGAVTLSLDTDKNGATGDPEDGTEYTLWAGLASGTVSTWATKWTGSDWADLPQSSTMSFAWSGDTGTWTLNKSDLGGASGFALYAFAFRTTIGVPSPLVVDFAPDSGRWTYDLSTPPPPPPPTPTPAPSAYKPVIGAPMTTPARAVAGKRLTVTFPVTRSDTGAPLTTGKIVCDPSVAGKVLVHAESFKGGNPKLSFVIPKTAKGKLLKVKVTIKAGAKPATKLATFRVK